MIKILHIVSSLDRGSGVMNVIMNYYRNIDGRKIQFDFLSWSEEDRATTYSDEIEELGGNIYSIQKPGLTKTYYNDIKLFFEKYAWNYKAVQLHEVYLNMFIAPMARKYGINHIIAHSHTTEYSDIKLNAIRNRILCVPLKYNTDIYFACSKAAGEFLYGKKYVQRGKVKIIQNAIDCEKFCYKEEIRTRKRKEFNLQEKFVVGHIGRFNEQKNHEFIVDIFFKIYNENKNSVLMLVGEGFLKEEIKKKVNKLKIADRVFFLGQRTDVDELLQVMDVFVLPSLFEGLPVVLVEAQSSGLPCYTSNAVTKEVKITDNINYLSLKTSAEVWADNILKNNQLNRQDNSENVRNAGFDIKIETKKLEKIYLNLA